MAGVLFIKMDDINQRIFFPAADNIQNQDRKSGGTLCSYLSAYAYAKDLSQAYTLYISGADSNGDGYADGISMNQILSRCLGFSIRPVSD